MRVLRTLMSAVPVPMFLYTEKFLFANPAFYALTGYAEEELVHVNVWDLFEEGFADTIMQAIRLRRVNRLDDRECQLRMRTRSGEERWVLIVTTTTTHEGAYVGLATLIDMTDKKLLDLERERKARLWSDIFAYNSAVMLMIDPESGRILQGNEAASRFYGYSADELRRLHIGDINTMQREGLQRKMLEAAEKETNAFVFEHRLAGGESRIVEVYSTPVQSEDRRILFSIIHDITARVEYEKQLKELNSRLEKSQVELKRANRLLKELSGRDSLTGIANRRYLDQYLTREWRRAARSGRPISLIMFDLDYYKAYNDALGHQQGDECLKRIARAVRRVVQRPGDLFARYGGEEFAIVLPDTDAAGARAIAEKTRAAVNALRLPHPDSEVGPFLTVSIGVTTRPAVEPDPRLLVQRADEALYQAKREGRNRIVSLD